MAGGTAIMGIIEEDIKEEEAEIKAMVIIKEEVMVVEDMITINPPIRIRAPNSKVDTIIKNNMTKMSMTINNSMLLLRSIILRLFKAAFHKLLLVRNGVPIMLVAIILHVAVGLSFAFKRMLLERVMYGSSYY